MESVKLTWVEIKKSAIKNNLNQFRHLLEKKVKIMAVVKSNAYGHGMEKVAKIAQQSGADWLGVVNSDEALRLRTIGIKGPIFILSYWDFQDMGDKIYKIKDVDFPLYTLEQAKILSYFGKKMGRPINVHIKIDTGASRIGLLTDQAIDFIKQVKKIKNLSLRGIFTHYAASEREDQTYTNQQTKIFNDLLTKLKLVGIDNIPFIHAGCSASTIINPSTYFNLVRIGIALYGLWPSPETQNLAKKQKRGFVLEPALSWKTKVIQVKELPARTFIGYDCSYQTKKRTKIAILPIGYWDGFDRKLSNKGEVLIQGRRCPVRGRVCMNLTMVELPLTSNVKPGDEVVLIGQQGKEKITADELAEKIGTINYEVVTRINPLIPRQ